MPVQKTKTTKTVSKPKSVKMSNKDMMPKIKVIGVGGSGKNVTNYMIKHDVKGVKFVTVNTDAQDLDQSKATKKIHIGKSTTAGSGTGMNPEIGRQAALENKDDLIKILQDTSIVFLAGGMGGGTGTGATPVIAQIAKDMGILTIAVVTKPFSFEGGKRRELALEGIEELGKYVDSYIVIPNDKILEVADSEATMNDAFALSDDVLLQAVTGIANLITTPGRINIDASDVRTVLENQGLSLVGIGSGRGDNRATEAARAAINSPLLDISVRGAQAVLFSITAGDDLKMSEVAAIAETITSEIDEEATVKFGTIRDLKLKKGEIKVTVVASGFMAGEQHSTPPGGEILAAHSLLAEEATDDIFKEMEQAGRTSTKAEIPSKVLTLIQEESREESQEKKVEKKQSKGKMNPELEEKISEDDTEDFWSLPGFLKK